MAADPAFEARMVRWCIEHVEPPLTPQIGYVVNPTNPATAFGVVRVEPSVFTPHTVDGGTRVYVRRADNSDPRDATIHEIELLRDRRRLEVERQERHYADLSTRIAPPETRRDRRSLALIMTPVFSAENAIAFRELPDTAEELKRRGFKIGELRSYSQGLLGKHQGGFNFALTNRAGLAFSRVLVPAGASAPEPTDLEALLGWSLLAATAVRTLALKSGYWGGYRIWFEARNNGGLGVVDGREGDEYARCADQRIEISDEWSTVEVRDDPFGPAGRLYWRLMWAFGQHAQMWTDARIRSRLELQAKELGTL